VQGIKCRASSINIKRIDGLYQDSLVDNRDLILHYGGLNASSNLTRILQEVQPEEFYNLGEKLQWR
jgi:GDPmannose 4,6-dehydratase